MVMVIIYILELNTECLLLIYYSFTVGESYENSDY